MSAEPLNLNEYTPAANPSAEAVLASCIHALTTRVGLRLYSKQLTSHDREMIVVECTFDAESLDIDMVQADLAAAWKDEVVSDATSLHVVSENGSGFDFRFAILQQDARYVTGVIRCVTR